LAKKAQIKEGPQQIKEGMEFKSEPSEIREFLMGRNLTVPTRPPNN